MSRGITDYMGPFPVYRGVLHNITVLNKMLVNKEKLNDN